MKRLLFISLIVLIFSVSSQVFAKISFSACDMEWTLLEKHDVSLDEAKDWIERLGDGWRLPTMEELKALSEAVGNRELKLPFRYTNSIWSSDREGNYVYAFSYQHCRAIKLFYKPGADNK